MNKINIEELHPSEAALSANKVAKFLEALTNGNEVAPVKVTNLEGFWGVRDGNNRVRAYAEFGKLNGTSPEIPCEEVSFGATQFFAREGLRALKNALEQALKESSGNLLDDPED